MQRNLFDIQGKAADGQDKEVILWSALEIPRPDLFLQVREDHTLTLTRSQLLKVKEAHAFTRQICLQYMHH